MANRVRTGDPIEFNKGRSLKFREGSHVRQTAEEGQKTYQPKHYENNNKNEDNSPKTLMIKKKKEKFYDKKILRVIFFRNSIPKALVSDNTPEFCDEDLNLWMEKIGCKPYKTSPYHPQLNGLAERMVQTIKMGLNACFQHKEKMEVFLPRLLLSYYTIPHAGRLESPSALMGRKIRALLTVLYSTNE